MRQAPAKLAKRLSASLVLGYAAEESVRVSVGLSREERRGASLWPGWQPCSMSTCSHGLAWVTCIYWQPPLLEKPSDCTLNNLVHAQRPPGSRIMPRAHILHNRHARRSSRSARPPSRTSVCGCATRAAQDTTTRTSKWFCMSKLSTPRVDCACGRHPSTCRSHVHAQCSLPCSPLELTLEHCCSYFLAGYVLVPLAVVTGREAAWKLQWMAPRGCIFLCGGLLWWTRCQCCFAARPDPNTCVGACCL